MSALICFTNRRKHSSTTASGTRNNYPANTKQGSGWSAQLRDAWGYCIVMVILTKNLPAICYGRRGCSAGPKAFASKWNCLLKNEIHFPGIYTEIPSSWWGLMKPCKIRCHQVSKPCYLCLWWTLSAQTWDSSTCSLTLSSTSFCLPSPF